MVVFESSRHSIILAIELSGEFEQVRRALENAASHTSGTPLWSAVSALRSRP